MLRDGVDASGLSKSSNSIPVAFFENTLKFTPFGNTVAPSGAQAPAATRVAIAAAAVSPITRVVRRARPG